MRGPRRLLLVAGLLGTLVGGTNFSGAAFTAQSANPANRFTSTSDWIAPTVSLVDPGTPLRGTVTLAASATDILGSGVASVAFELRAPGSSSWTTVCTDTIAPYTCSIDTSAYADGSYDLRALATDNAGNTATSVVGSRTFDNAAFAVTLADPGANIRGQVPLTATVSTGGSLVAAVKLQIRVAETTAWTDICTDVTAPYGCTLDTTKYAADLYDLRAVATNAVGTTVTSVEINDVQIDNVAPTVSLTDPGVMRGVVTLTTTAADADAGIDTVAIQRSPAGSGTWTTICTASADPYSCRFDTTTDATPDGKYDLRAIATDYAGNTTTSAVLAARTIDNSTPTVTMEDPGSYVRGTAVTLTATPYAAGGVASTTIRIRKAGVSTWTTICTKTASPWTCALDSTAYADGAYELSATMVAKSSATATSSTVTTTIDNAPMRGLDVQATNKAGGALGKPETGDTLKFTWSDAPKPSTLVAGWAGTSATTVVVRIKDGTIGTQDILDVTTTGGAVLPGFGSINLKGNYVKKNKTVSWVATATLSGSSVTLTLGTITGSARTWGTASAMVWTPGAAATDLAGNATSPAPVTETGALDKDF